MALTKGDIVIDACQEIAAGALVKGRDNEDLSGDYDMLLHLWLALSDTTAHTGTKIIVQTCVDGASDEDWTDLPGGTRTMLIGTAADELVDDNPLLAAATTITISDTTGFVTKGVWLFLEDVDTFANSEWIIQKSHIANTSIELVDGVARQHAVNSILYNVAQTLQVVIPMSAQRVRVLYNNLGNSTIAIRSKLGRITAV